MTDGFRIAFNNPSLSSVQLVEALQHSQVVDDDLKTEIAEHHVAGLFHTADIIDAHISRIVVILKQHKTNKWRLIMALFHPVELYVNNGIPKDLRSPSSWWIQ